MSSSAVRGARIGEVPQAEGFERINVAAFPTLQKSRFAAVGEKPPRSVGPLPLSRRRCGDTGGDIAAISSSAGYMWMRHEPKGGA